MDAKLDAGSSSSFGDMTSQNSLGRKEQVIKFGYLPPENGFNFVKKMSFYVQNRSSRPKIAPPPVNFSNFQAEENFFIFKIFGTSE